MLGDKGNVYWEVRERPPPLGIGFRSSRLGNCMKMLFDQFEKRWLVPVILLGVTLLSHGFLLLADFVIHDGWWILAWLEEKDWQSLKYVSDASGLYFQRYLTGVFLFFSEPNVAAKISTFILLYLISIVTFILFKQSSFFSKKESLFIAIVCLTLPAVRIHGQLLVTMVFVSMYLLFLICTLMALTAETKSGILHVTLRILALIGFFVSFTLGSLLVFYYGFVVFLLFYQKKHQQYPGFTLPWRWITKRIDYIFLPIIFWVWRRIFVPGIGENLNYQQPSLEASLKIPGHIVSLLVYTIPHQLFGGLSKLFSFPVVGVLVICASYFIARFSRGRFSLIGEKENKLGTLPIILFSIFLLFAAVFPYWAIGAVPQPDGFDTRLAMLIPIPMAIILLVVFRIIPKIFYNSIGQFALMFLFVFMTLSFSAVQLKTYYDWQTISIKEKSIIHNLSKVKEVKNYKLVKVQDQFMLNVPYEQSWDRWRYILKFVCGDYQRYAFGTYKLWNAYIYPDKQKIVEDIMGDIGRAPFLTVDEKNEILNGKQGILTIRAGKFFAEYNAVLDQFEQQPTLDFRIGKRENLSLVGSYLYYRFFKPERLNNYLSTLTVVDLVPVDDLLL